MAARADDRPYLPRLADGILERRLRATGAVLIEGVKACGKTETARQKAASEVLDDVGEVGLPVSHEGRRDVQVGTRVRLDRD